MSRVVTSQYVAADECGGTGDGPIYMGFGGQMNDGVDAVLTDQFADQVGIGDCCGRVERHLVGDADLVVLCTPISGMAGLAKRILPPLKPGTVLTDVGSTKQQLVAGLTPLCAEGAAHYVGSQPMAGSDQTGPGAARADLFEDTVCVVTPTADTHADTLTKVNDFWSSLGSQPVVMPADTHDRLVARCSHLPHLLASALARRVLDNAHGQEQAQLCATGFRDMTRLAACLLYTSDAADE